MHKLLNTKTSDDNTVRNKKIDFIRGIAIILVVVGHCIQNGGNQLFFTNNLYFENILFKIIYSFHLPLFSLLSGYLLFSSLTNKSTFQSIKHTIKVYLVPIFFWTVILRIVYLIYDKSSFYFEFKSFLYNFLTNYWFLWAVLFNNIIISIINGISKRFMDNNLCKEIVLFLCILITLTILPDYWLQNHKFLLPFGYCGYLFKRFQVSNKYCIRTLLYYWVLIFTFPLYLILLFNFHKINYIYISGISLYNAHKYGIGVMNQIYYNLFRFILGLVGSILCILIINLLWKLMNKIPIIIHSITQIGKQSIVIYCGSGLIQGTILAFFIKLFNSYSNNTDILIDYKIIFCSTIVLICVSTIIGMIIDRITILRLLLKGKK